MAAIRTSDPKTERAGDWLGSGNIILPQMTGARLFVNNMCEPSHSARTNYPYFVAGLFLKIYSPLHNFVTNFSTTGSLVRIGNRTGACVIHDSLSNKTS
jgi:hypothetical protein